MASLISSVSFAVIIAKFNIILFVIIIVIPIVRYIFEKGPWCTPTLMGPWAHGFHLLPRLPRHHGRRAARRRLAI